MSKNQSVYADKEIEYLWIILRCAVKGVKPPKPPEDFDWDKFFFQSKKQQVYSMIIAMTDSLDLPESFTVKLKNQYNSELVRLIAMKNEFEAIKNALNQHKVKYIPLKGYVLRDYYPKQSMRQMSDIDVLYDASKEKDVKNIMSEMGYKLISDGGNSDDFVKEPFYTFELHRKLFKDVYGFCPDFSFVWDNAVKVNEYEYAMKIEDFYLHTIAHMYKHYIFGGFGIRFLIDVYLIVLHEEVKWDRDYLDSKLEELGLLDFEKTVKKLAFDFVENKELSYSQMEFIENNICAGIYGSSKIKLDAVLDNYIKEHKKITKFGYLLYRIFPSKAQMISYYPILARKKYLFGFYYLKRLITKSSKGTGKVFSELKQIKNISKNNGG